MSDMALATFHNRHEFYRHRIVRGEVNANIAAMAQIELPRLFPGQTQCEKSVRANESNRTDNSPRDRSVFS